MASEEIDLSAYVRSPVLDVASGVALSAALLAAVPKDGSEGVKRAAKKLRKEAQVLQQAWTTSDVVIAVPDRRRVDTRVDNAWGILLDRLEAFASLPVATFPKAARARELVDSVSPDRQWLNLQYNAEWAESDKRLRRIEAEGLQPDIDALAGKEFLSEVRSAHAEYGQALGMEGPTAESVEVNLAAPLRSVAAAIARYSRAVIGDLDEEDPASVRRTRVALRPIDEHRLGQARRASAGGGAAEAPAPAPSPALPLPEVP
jgi:hypothetical protein